MLKMQDIYSKQTQEKSAVFIFFFSPGSFIRKFEFTTSHSDNLACMSFDIFKTLSQDDILLGLKFTNS